MEKYAVVQEPEKTKTASKDKTCPQCGLELEENSQFLLFCKKCGTEPWERADNGQSKGR